MKHNPPLTPRLFTFGAMFLALAISVPAASFFKADTTNYLNSAGSWLTNGIAATVNPTNVDLVIWDATVATPANNTNGLSSNVGAGTNRTWGGIAISNAPVTVNITNDPAANRTIILRSLPGVPSINVDGQDLRIGVTLTYNDPAGSNTTININAGRLLTLDQGRTFTMNRDVTLTGTGTFRLNRRMDVNSNATLSIGPGMTIDGDPAIGLADLRIGNAAAAQVQGGRVVQTGGSVSLVRTNAGAVMLIGNIDLGALPNATNSYRISGGTLNTRVNDLGTVSIGPGTNQLVTFEASGTAQVMANAITVAGGGGTVATLTMGNSATLVTTNLTVGSRGTGVLTISNNAAVTVSNTLTLAGSADPVFGTGTVNLEGGTLAVGRVARGSGGVTNFAMINFNGGTLVALSNAATFVGATTILNVSNAAARIDTGANIITNSQGLLHNNDVSTDGGLIKTGSGSLTLNGTNTFTGPTIVSAGTVIFSTVHAGGGAIQMADNTGLGVRVITNTGSLVASALTLGTSVGASLGVNTLTNGMPIVPVIIATNLATAGTVPITIVAGGTGLTLGTFKLIDYEGSIGGAGFGAFTIASLPAGVSATLVNNTTESSVDVMVTAIPRALTWNGNVNGNWTIGGAANWLDQTPASTAYQEGDLVTFDDTATGTTSLVLDAIVNPGGVALNFTHGGNYSVTGSGAVIGGVGLAKTGAGTLIMGVTNNYTGQTIISAGTFVLGTNNVIPDGAGRGSLQLDGTLDLNGFNEAVNGFTGTNTGVVNNTGANPVSFTIGSNGVAGYFDGVIKNDGAPLKLFKVGGQTNILTGINSYSGGTELRQGITVITNGNAFGPVNAPFSIGATLLTFGNLTNTGPVVTLVGNTTINISNNSTVRFDGAVLSTNNNNVTKSGDGELILNGGGSFGSLIANNGRITVNGGGVTNGAVNNIGVGTGANATMVLNGVKMYATNASQDFAVGATLNAVGTLHVTNNAELYVSDFWLGRLASATGLVYQSSGIVSNVDPANTEIRLAGNDDGTHTNTSGSYFLSGGRFDVIKSLHIGANGTGLVRITGGELKSWDGTVSVGRYSNSVGTLEVLGGQFTQNSNNLIIGNVGNGTLIVSNTGIVTLAANLQIGSTTNTAGVKSSGTVVLGTGGLIQTLRVLDGTGDSTFRFNGGTIEATGSSTDFFRTLTNVFIMANGARINTGTNTITINQELLTDAVSTGGGLTKSGAGTLTLTATNTYTGQTLVTAGRLFITPTFAGVSDIIVNDGAGFGVRRTTASNITSTASRVVLGTAGATTLDFDLGNFGNPTNPAAVIPNFTANGTVTVNITGGNLTVGTFKLIDYATAINGGGFGALTLGTLPTGVSAVLVNNVADTSVDLQVTATVPLTWSGATDNKWDIGATTNWLLNLAPRVFTQNDPVLFDDSAAGSTDVLLVTNVTPSAIVVSNVTKNYSFNGTNRITGALNFTKLGAGVVTFATPNDYNGLTLISAGTLKLGTNHVIPNGTGRSNIINGTLDMNGFNDDIMALEGSGIVANTGVSNVSLGIATNSTSGTFTGVIQDNGGGALLIEKLGSGTNVLTGASPNWRGGVYINTGTLAFGQDAALGTGIVTVDDGGTLATFGGNRVLTNAVNSSTNTGDANISTDGGNLTLTGPVNWSVPDLNKDGLGTLTFAPSSVVTLGATAEMAVNGGTLILDGPAVTMANDGLRTRAGTNFTSVALIIQNNANVRLDGAANFVLGATANTNVGPLGLTNLGTFASGIVTISNGGFFIGNSIGNTATFDHNGGTLTFSTTTNINGVAIANNTNTAGTYNLNGGTLVTARVRRTLDTNTSAPFINSTATFAFNGGVLKALNASSGSNFISGIDNLLVRANGARIDSDNYDLSIQQALIQDGTSPGGGLVKLGSGALALNGTNTYTGSTIVSNGLLRGTGSIAGAVTVAVGGRLGAGDAGIGTLTVNGGVTVTGGATLKINKTGVTLTADKVAVNGALALGGTLTVTASGAPLAAGDTFDLFDATAFSGGFASFNLPALPPELLWDTRNLTVNGTVAVVRVLRISSSVFDFGGPNPSVMVVASGGVPNAAYQVRSSSDVALPLSSWTVVASGTFDGSGNINPPVAIAIVPGQPQRFYVVVAP